MTKKPKPLRFDDEATRELQEASLWYHRERAGLGDELLEDVAATIEFIRKAPTSFTSPPGVPKKHGARRALLGRFPYSLIFHVSRTEVRVVAVAHAKRRPGYWVGRLRRRR